MNKGSNNAAGGYCLLLMLGGALVILPAIAIQTVVRDGWENAPDWMRVVTILTIGTAIFIPVAAVIDKLF